MASKSSSSSHLPSKQKTFLVLLLISLTLTFFVLSAKPKSAPTITSIFQEQKTKPAWFNVIEKNIDSKRVKIGLVNIDTRVDDSLYEQLYALHPQVMTVSVNFDHVDENLKWKELFPVWIDEEEKWGHPKCPDLPMPTWEDYRDLNVVVARVPCGNRDVFGLQVNLVVANLAVESGWVMKLDTYEPVYVVFIGSCGSMVEIFKCDDLLVYQPGEYWVYKPDLVSLRQKMLMPVGSCQLVPSYAETGKEVRRAYMSQSPSTLKQNRTFLVQRLAYVTILHSSEAYVCGAIALAHSILQTKNYNNYTRDLLLLADESISPTSIRALKSAGWKIKHIQRILNPFAKKAHTMSGIIVSFGYGNSQFIEPSQCMFEDLMQRTLEVKPYNGGDQGFLNEVFTWWHRLPAKVNFLKSFEVRPRNYEEEVPENAKMIHYVGLKPWMCYRDYDCNWDMKELHVFASDLAHRIWWQVYDTMPQELQVFCGLTKEMEERIVNRRRRAKDAGLYDGHWKIEVKDPRRNHYV